MSDELCLEDGKYQTIVKKNPVIRRKLTDIRKVIAPIPGIIGRVIRSVGEKVNSGETILTLEAMKMECALVSNFSGKIREILVKPGEKVEKNQILAILEEIDNGKKE